MPRATKVPMRPFAVLRIESPTAARTCSSSSPSPQKSQAAYACCDDSPSGSGASSGGSKASSGASFSGSERRAKYCSKLLRAACLHRLGFGPRRMLQVSTVLREALPPAPQAPLKGRAARRAEKKSAIGETPARSGSEARVRQRWRNPYPHADCQTERDEPDTIGTRPTGRAYVV